MTSAIHHALRGPAARATVPCLCAAALAGAASLATAQGSVTLYGRIVSGVDYMNRIAEGRAGLPINSGTPGNGARPGGGCAGPRTWVAA